MTFATTREVAVAQFDVVLEPPSSLLQLRTYVFLAVVANIQGALWFPNATTQSWHYFDTASRVLFSRSGLHLFAQHPELQFGPVSVLATRMIHLLGGTHERTVFACALVAALLPIIALIDRAAAALGYDRSRTKVLLVTAAFVLIPAWNVLAMQSGHIDDVLALVATTFAMWAVATCRPCTAALALALAVDSKPWAVAFLPLLLVFEGKALRNSAFVCAAGVLVAWLPFVLADHRTLGAASFAIRNDNASALRWFGVVAATTPVWDRAAQFVVGAVLATYLVRRGQWPSVLMAALSVRLLLDPAAHHYYSAGLLLGACIFDILVARWRWPWATIIMFVLVVIPWFRSLGLSASEQGAARFAGTTTGIVLAIAFAIRPDRNSVQLSSCDVV